MPLHACRNLPRLFLGRLSCFAAFALALFLYAATAQNAVAQAIFTVTTLSDTAAGVASHCSNQSAGGSLDANCNLRDALAAAAAVNGSSGTTAVTVNFAPSLAAVGNPGTLTLGANALALPTYTTVQGLTAGADYTLTNLIVIQGNAHIAFSADSSVTHAGLTNLTIANSAPALSSAGILTVSQCTFAQNSTTSGGAIYNAGTLTVLNSTFRGNAAVLYGGAIYSTGPNTTGLITVNNLTVSGSTFQGNNSATDGGAIYIGRASVGTIDRSTFTKNITARDGAAVFINNGSGLSRVTNSILSGDSGGNECAGTGCDGAVRAFVFAGSEPSGVNDSGNITMTINLSTGEIYTFTAGYGQYSSGASLASTFGAYISNGGGGLSAQGFDSTLEVGSQSGTITSVVFNNPSRYFTVTPVPNAVISGTGNTVAAGTAANLSALGSFGGPTQTILPLPGSAALCAFSPPSATGTDQRLLPRTTTYGTQLCQDSGAVQTNYGLTFAQQPASTSANAVFSPAPAIQLQESAHTLTQANSLVTMTDANRALSGTTSSTTNAAGVATFPNLFVTSAQTTDGLTASLTVGPNTVSATSSPFNVTPQPTATLTGSATFPLTAVGASQSQTFTFTNTGTTTLSITALTVGPSLEFTQTNACGLTLAPGASCAIAIVFRPIVAGSRSGSLTLTSTAAGYMQTVALNGTALVTAATLTGNSTFPNTLVGSATAAQNFTLTNTGATALALGGITVTGDFTQTNSCGASLAAGASCSLSVVFLPTASGARVGSLMVTTASSTTVLPVALTGSGFTLTGTLTGFGTYPNTMVGGTSSVQNFTFTNTGTAALTIAGIAVTGDFAQTNNCGASLAVNTTCTIAVAFTPSVSGVRSGMLSVSTNATSALAPVTLSGVGTQAQASLSSGLAFASTVVGTSSAAQPFLLTNTGNATLVLSGITILGDFKQSNDCGAFLTQGATCTISVTFTPTTIGSRVGSLLINSNAGVAIPAVALGGTGVAAPAFFLVDNTSGAVSTTIAVAAGATGTGLLKLTSANGFAGTVALTCAAQGNAPAGATCSITSPVTLAAGATANATVTIATTSRTQMAGLVMLPTPRGRAATLFLACLLVGALFRCRRSGLAMRLAGLLLLLFSLGIGITGCASSTSPATSSVVNANGTPAGTYTYIVTATSGALTANQSITVNVQ